MRKSWVVAGVVLVAFSAMSLNVPGRTLRWLEQAASWRGQAEAVQSRQEARQQELDSLAAAIMSREVQVQRREQTLMRGAREIDSLRRALTPLEAVPDTCQDVVRSRDAIIRHQDQQLMQQKAQTADWRRIALDERGQRLLLEQDTTELRALVRGASVVITTAPVRPSFWERIRPGVYAGAGVTGNGAGVSAPGATVLVGWKVFP